MIRTMKPNPAIRAQILQQASEVMQMKHMALTTERDYCGWIGRFYDFCCDLPKDLAAEAKMEAFLTHLAVVRDVSASTQNGAFHAIRFLYVQVIKRALDVAKVNALRATRPEQVRHAPSVEDTLALLRDVRDEAGYPANLVVRMLYGSGLRVSEPLNLRIKDVRFERRELILKAGKNSKDRVVRLPEAVIPELQQQIRHARRVWQQDVQDGIPVTLPHQLARKYPEYQFAWPWAFVFPMHKTCKHPRTGATVRWRMMTNIVQKAVKYSRRRLGIQVVPHELRHAYATHCLDRGVNLKALQEAMGHAQIETTAGYCHAEALSVASPLDTIAATTAPNILPFQHAA